MRDGVDWQALWVGVGVAVFGAFLLGGAVCWAVWT